MTKNFIQFFKNIRVLSKPLVKLLRIENWFLPQSRLEILLFRCVITRKHVYCIDNYIFSLYSLHKNKCIRLETLQFATEFVQIWSLNLAFTCLLLSLILFFCDNLLNYILVLIVWDTVPVRTKYNDFFAFFPHNFPYSTSLLYFAVVPQI